MRRLLVMVLSLVIMALPSAAGAGAVHPVNDNFADALALAEPLPAVAAVDTAGATIEVGEPVPSCIDDGEFGASVWYTFTPSAKVNAALDTLGSSYNTVVAIYTGAALNSLTEIACSDEISFSADTDDASRVAHILEAGVTYRIQVSGLLAATGSLELILVKRRFTPAVVRGDDWHLNGNYDGTAEHSFSYGSIFHYPLVGTFIGFAPLGDTGVSQPMALEGNKWFFNDWFDADEFAAYPFGKFTDFPVSGDLDGDGDDDIGVVRGNVWYFDTDFDGVADEQFAFGSATDYPIMGDWNADGVFTPGVVRGNVWYLNNDFDGDIDIAGFAYGKATDFPLVGDWDGDGDWTPMVVRDNFWFRNNAFDGSADVPGFTYGKATDFPLVGDWDRATG